MFWETLNFTTRKKNKRILGNTGVKLTTINMEKAAKYVDSKDTAYIGVDPGVHFGITIILPGVFDVIWGTLLHSEEFIGLESTAVIQQLFCDYELNRFAPDNTHMYIEGPAFNARYGQTKLEQCRYGFVVGMSPYITHSNIQYISPSTARKKAFGSGKQKASDIWINIDPNAADSVGLALTCLYDIIPDFS